MGVSVRRLLGWEPAEVTTFERDGAGRIVRAVTVRESEFSPLDHAWLVESRKRANIPRGRHGVPIEEATDRANFGKFKVPMPLTDLAAKALREAEESWETRNGKGSTKDLLFWVELDES